jgi:outer membrane protein OmpA-like peptidoglycan-associated protein/tetratricopeptide (TPR) repeat protein
MRILALTILVVFNFNPNLLGQESKSSMAKKADEFYKAGRYFDALPIFQKLEEQDLQSLELKEKLGICYYHTNQLGEARKCLRYVADSQKSPAADVFLYLGAVHHAEAEFAEAALQYKACLRAKDLKAPFREMVKQRIRNCAYGIRNGHQRTELLVETLGPKINSTGDDFAPILSPNYDNRIYFASAREGALGGHRDAQGLTDEKNGALSSDMFSANLVSGEWTGAAPLSYLLNSPRHDIILDFSDDGSRMYFFKGYTTFSGEILVDTFRKIENRSLFSQPLLSPLFPEQGDVSLCFFDDSTLLFASRRSGGYGGLDLYITLFENGNWTLPENLGPTINSPYDECHPFLATDGRTLYFSSNRSDRSFGGFDIFRTQFDDAQESWQESVNLGLPINSAGDEEYFRLAPDGMKAYFSSSRKTGLGERDLYGVYFKNYQTEMADHSWPMLFCQVLAYKKRLEAEGLMTEENVTQRLSQREMEQFSFEPLFFNQETDLLKGENLQLLNQAISLLKAYPLLKLLLTSHSDHTEPDNYDLYFSIKRAEKIADFLASNGVAPARMVLKGCGKQYPAAKNELKGQPNPAGQRLNRRIEFTFTHIAPLPVQIQYTFPFVNDMIKSGEADHFRRITQGLSYKVEVATLGQMYNGDLLQQFGSPMVERSFASKEYHYTVGSYQVFSSAELLHKELEKQGILQAAVIPYINGLRVEKTDLSHYTKAFPDLRNYLAANENKE